MVEEGGGGVRNVWFGRCVCVVWLTTHRRTESYSVLGRGDASSEGFSTVRFALRDRGTGERPEFDGGGMRVYELRVAMNLFEKW